MRMIILRDVIEAINKSQINEGWLVGGVVERGWSNRDADLVVANSKVAEGLPSYFDVIVQEGKPEGPNIPVAGLKQLLAFKFEFMKPAKTQSNSNEFYDINDFKNLKPGDYFVEPKYDGIRVQLRKAGYKVWILTDSGNDITEKLPNIAEEARTKIPFTVCILDCELADRKKILAKVPWCESIHPIKYKLVKAEGVIAAIEEMTTSEGAMIKDETKIQIAEAAPKTPSPAVPTVETIPAAPTKPEPAVEAAPPAPETAPKPDALEKVLGEFSDMKKTMSDMLVMIGEMKNMMGERQVQSSPAQEAAPEAIAESQGYQIERPPRVKESKATPNAAQSSFFNEVKKLVR